MPHPRQAYATCNASHFHSHFSIFIMDAAQQIAKLLEAKKRKNETQNAKRAVQRALLKSVETKIDTKPLAQKNHCKRKAVESDDSDASIDEVMSHTITNRRLKRMKRYLIDGDVKSCEKLDYDLYLKHGEKIKASLFQELPSTYKPNPHLWIYGSPGTGKTALMQYVYPQMYKKDLSNRFFELYHPNIHTHVMLEDLDHEAIMLLKIQFMKTLCDEAGFCVDQKFKSCQLHRTSVLVTSNFNIRSLVPDGIGHEESYMALKRRFKEICIHDLLVDLGIKMVSAEQRRLNRKLGSEDCIFERYDWKNHVHVEEPMYTPEELQARLFDMFM